MWPARRSTALPAKVCALREWLASWWERSRLMWTLVSPAAGTAAAPVRAVAASAAPAARASFFTMVLFSSGGPSWARLVLPMLTLPDAGVEPVGWRPRYHKALLSASVGADAPGGVDRFLDAQSVDPSGARRPAQPESRLRWSVARPAGTPTGRGAG